MFATNQPDSAAKLFINSHCKTVEDPLRKREQFAVSLRKAKTKAIVEGRRMKLLLPTK